MTVFSVNVNKIAWLRNSRIGSEPSVVRGCEIAIENGARGITVHPREDQRHITLDDVCDIAAMPQIQSGDIEFNIEGDLRPELLRLAQTLKPTQFTVVPVIPGEDTSSRGWRAYDDHAELTRWCELLKDQVRVAVFVDPDPRSVELAAACGCDAIEIYTGSFAKAFGDHTAELAAVASAAERARALGLQVNAGHDLNTENLPVLFEAAAIDEVSIGQAIATRGIFEGLGNVVADFRNCIPNQ